MHIPAVSIIVPVYKAEAFLERCVDSILGQTFRDFELILVDDGSPDKCPALCDAIAQRILPEIIVIHKENGGVSSARNAGLRSARGKWIQFVDADDYLGPNYCEALYTAAEREGAEWCWGCATWVLPDRTSIEGYAGALEGETALTEQDFAAQFGDLYRRKRLAHIWNKLYLRERIRQDFDEGMAFAEDSEFNLRYAAALTGKIALTGCAEYFYDRRNESSTMVRFSGYQAQSCLKLGRALRQLVEARRIPDGEQIYYRGFFDDLIFETQYLIYRVEPQECRGRLREYLLAPETQETVRRVDARKLSRTHRLAAFLIRRRWLGAYTAVFRFKKLIKFKKL